MTQQICLAITLKNTQGDSPSEQLANIPGWEQMGKLDETKVICQKVSESHGSTEDKRD